MNKNKLNMIIAILGSVTILSISGLVFNQIQKNHKTNELIIEKCFEKFDENEKLVVTKDGLWSPVVCEKN